MTTQFESTQQMDSLLAELDARGETALPVDEFDEDTSGPEDEDEQETAAAELEADDGLGALEAVIDQPGGQRGRAVGVAQRGVGALGVVQQHQPGMGALRPQQDLPQADGQAQGGWRGDVTEVDNSGSFGYAGPKPTCYFFF